MAIITVDLPTTINFGDAFPLSVASTGRFLQTADGQPFLVAQDAAWNAPILLTSTEVGTYLDDRKARGFTTCLVNVIDTTATTNANGNQVFSTQLNGSAWNGTYDWSQSNTTQPDFTTANSSYFSHVASFVAAAKTRSMAVLLLGAYLGFSGGQEGWMTAEVQNDAVTGWGSFGSQSWSNNTKSKLWNYGAYLGNLLKGYNNIIWVMGGDYFPSAGAQLNAVKSYVDGVRSVIGSTPLWSGHWSPPSISKDISSLDATLASYVTLDGCYAFDGTIAGEGRTGFSYSPTLPAFPLEFPYEKEGPSDLNRNGAATDPIRRYTWWGWLSSVGGIGYGNGYIWDFGATWASHLNDPAVQDFARQVTFAKTIAWQKLLPSGLGGAGTLVTANGGTIGGPSSDYIAAAVASDGSCLVAYVPPAWALTNFTVSLTGLRGAWTGQWFNPSTGAYTSAGSGTNSGTHVFTPPSSDYVLLLSA